MNRATQQELIALAIDAVHDVLANPQWSHEDRGARLTNALPAGRPEMEHAVFAHTTAMLALDLARAAWPNTPEFAGQWRDSVTVNAIERAEAAREMEQQNHDDSGTDRGTEA